MKVIINNWVILRSIADLPIETGEYFVVTNIPFMSIKPPYTISYAGYTYFDKNSIHNINWWEKHVTKYNTGNAIPDLNREDVLDWVSVKHYMDLPKRNGEYLVVANIPFAGSEKRMSHSSDTTYIGYAEFDDNLRDVEDWWINHIIFYRKS